MMIVDTPIQRPIQVHVPNNFENKNLPEMQFHKHLYKRLVNQFANCLSMEYFDSDILWPGRTEEM